MSVSPPLYSKPSHSKKQLGNYILGETLGEGTFGKVKAAVHRQTGEKVAIKILEKEKIVDDVADVQRVTREIHILKLVRHPNIIQLYEIIETPKQLFLVMEYVEHGELFHYIVKNKRLPEAEACAMFHQLISGIAYIHQLNIVHRDLKPQNLLLDFNKSLKLVDFGLSNTYKKGETLKTPCGSPCYAPPEMIKGEKYSGLKVDIWSSGVILFAMICGCLPFEDENTSLLYKKILSGKYVLSRGVSQEAKDLISKILQVDPEKRYNIQQIRDHAWMRQNNNSARNPIQGIIVGFNRIPIQEKIISQAQELGFDAQYMTKCVQANRHNAVTTAYHLLFKKFLRNGGISSCDMGGPCFDKSLIEPNKRKEKSTARILSNLSAELSNSSNKENMPNKDINKSKIQICLKDVRKHQEPVKYASVRVNSSFRNQRKFQQNNNNNNANNNQTLNDKSLSKLQNSSILNQNYNNSKSHISTSKQTSSREPLINRISQKYRDDFNRSIVSKSQERSTHHGSRLEINTTTSQNRPSLANRSRITSNVSVKSKDRAWSHLDPSVSRQKNRPESLEPSMLEVRGGQTHKRGKSSTTGIRRSGKPSGINQSFNGSRNGDIYYKKQQNCVY